MSSHSHHHICGGTAKLSGERIYKVACLKCQVALVAYFFKCRAYSVPINFGEIRQCVEIVLAVNVVNVKGFKSVLTESADKVAGINADDGRMTDIKTSHKPIAVQSINVANEFLGARAGGVVNF